MNKQNKLLISIISIAILVLSVFAVLKLIKSPQKTNIGAAPASTMFISPANQQVEEGGTADFSVKVDTGENKVTGVDIIVKFDPSILEVVSLVKGENITNFDNIITEEIDNSTGRVVYSIFNIDVDEAVSGSAIEFLKIRTKVRDNVSGNYNLVIDPSSAASAVSESQNVITRTENASFEVKRTEVVNPTGEPNSCGGTCGSNYNCKEGLFCFNGYCRNPQCSNRSDCSCTQEVVVTPTPRIIYRNNTTTTTTREIEPTPVTSAVPDDYVTYTPDLTSENGAVVSTEPLPRVSEVEESQPENKLSNIVKVLVGVTGGALVITLLYYAISYLRNRNSGPRIINPD